MEDQAEAAPAFKENPSSSIRFLEALKWLDQSVFAPFLNEQTMEVLYKVNKFLDQKKAAAAAAS